VVNVTEAVETAIFKALDKDPAGRYRTAGEFLDALEGKVAGETGGAGSTAETSSKKGCLSVLAGWIVMEIIIKGISHG
jgi:hypothetical protein